MEECNLCVRGISLELKQDAGCLSCGRNFTRSAAHWFTTRKSHAVRGSQLPLLHFHNETVFHNKTPTIFFSKLTNSHIEQGSDEATSCTTLYHKQISSYSICFHMDTPVVHLQLCVFSSCNCVTHEALIYFDTMHLRSGQYQQWIIWCRRIVQH